MNNLYLIISLFIGGLLLILFFFWLISFIITTKKKLKESNTMLENLYQTLSRENKEIIQDSISQALNNANRFLIDSNNNIINSSNMTLQEIIKPLKENITEYKNRSEDLTNRQSQEIGKLQAQLKNVLETHNRLSEETNNLTQALRGNVKIQGNLGEGILKRVLECSGLKKDTNYLEQPTCNSETGKKRPDFIIKLPEGKDIIIDAKLSLNSYLDYWKSNEEDKDKCISEMEKAFVNHVKGLSPKEYYASDGINSPKAVLLFIPIESIYLILSERFDKLFLEAGKNNVYIVTATTLMPLLQIVENMWTIHDRNENVHQMAKIAGNIYDKYSGMLEHIDNLDKTINKACEDVNWQISSFKKKYNGKGGLTFQVSRLKALGADTNKNMPLEWVSDSAMLNQAEATENKGE